MSTKAKKIVKFTGISVVTVLLILVLGLYAMFHNEVSTINSINKLNDYPLYQMEYKGDYGFDSFLETGASNDKELVDFVVKRLLKGLPIEIKIPSHGCSTFRAENENGDRIFG